MIHVSVFYYISHHHRNYFLPDQDERKPVGKGRRQAHRRLGRRDDHHTITDLPGSVQHRIGKTADDSAVVTFDLCSAYSLQNVQIGQSLIIFVFHMFRPVRGCVYVQNRIRRRILLQIIPEMLTHPRHRAGLDIQDPLCHTFPR